MLGVKEVIAILIVDLQVGDVCGVDGARRLGEGEEEGCLGKEVKWTQNTQCSKTLSLGSVN